MIEGSSSQDDGIVVGPFGGVAPGALQGIPEMASGRVAHDPLWETTPHQEGKVHLGETSGITVLLLMLVPFYWFYCTLCVFFSSNLCIAIAIYLYFNY